MSNHKLACLVIGLIVFLMGFGVNKVRGIAVKAKQDGETARTEAETAERQRKFAEIQLQSLSAKTSQLRDSYDQWLPHFESFRNTGDGEQRIAEVIREGDVFVLSQKFKASKIEGNGFISHSLRADLIVEDEYSKVMNWLGKLEEQIPACQIAHCKITRGDRGNDVHLEMQIQVPIVRSIPTAQPKPKATK